jgi:hypothetical protein
MRGAALVVALNHSAPFAAWQAIEAAKRKAGAIVTYPERMR